MFAQEFEHFKRTVALLNRALQEADSPDEALEAIIVQRGNGTPFDSEQNEALYLYHFEQTLEEGLDRIFTHSYVLLDDEESDAPDISREDADWD